MKSLYVTRRAIEQKEDESPLDSIFEVRMFKKIFEGKTLTKEEHDEIWRDKNYPAPEDDPEVDVESADLYGIREQGPI